MTDPIGDGITARIATLERQMLHMKRLGFVALLLVGAGLTMAALPSASVIRARLFVVVDDSGKERAHLGLSSEGEALLTLFDRRQTRRVSLGLYEGGEPFLKLAERHGHARVWIQAIDDARDGQLSGVYLADERARPRAAFVLDGKGGPSMTFFDDERRSRLWLASEDDGASFLVLGDDRARPRLSLRADDDGRPAFQLFDRHQHARMQLAMEKSDVPFFTLNDRNGTAIFSAPQSSRLASASPPFPASPR